MTTTANIDVASAKKQEPQSAKKPAKVWAWLIVASCLLAIAAWGLMMYKPAPSIICAAVGAVASLVSSIFIGRSLWRDIAITCLIACCILLLVYGILYWALEYALRTI